MKQITIVAVALFLGATSFAGDTNVTGKTYTFTIPGNVTFESHEKLEFYTFKWGTPPHLALFMLNVNPVPMTANTLKPMADMMEIAFEDQMQQQGSVSEIQKKRTEIELGPFKGTEIEFIVTHSAGITIRQYMFILHDGERVWNGQLTSSSTNDIAQAHAIMAKARRVVNSGEE